MKPEDCRPDGRIEMAENLRRSRDIMAGAVAGWLRNASPAQAVVIRFVKNCFDRDIRAVSELAACREQGDVFGLNESVGNNLVSEYLAEGARVLALHAAEGCPRPVHRDLRSDLSAARTDEHGFRFRGVTAFADLARATSPDGRQRLFARG